MKPGYMNPDSTMTLKEGLAEYYHLNKGLLAPDSLDEAAAEMFRRHDAGHVVFACDTSLRGETLIDTWTVMATTAGLKGYLEYFKYPQVNKIFKDVGYLVIAFESCKALPAVCRIIGRGLTEKKKWPWNNYRSFLDLPLSDIRSQFGIKTV